MKRTYRYSRAVIARAYARSAVGLGATLIPLLMLEPALWVGGVLLPVAGLFLVYLAKWIGRHTASMVLDEQGIKVQGLYGVDIEWDDLRAVQLNYYTTRNDRSHGWIELVVRGTLGVVRVESDLQGFEDIVARVVHEAVRRDCALDDRTRLHLGVLGINAARTSSYAVDILSAARHA